MERQTKIDQVQQLREEMDKLDSIFLCNFKGLSVDTDTQLRREIRENGSKYQVVKNTLLKLVFADSDFSQLNDQLVGNTAIAYTEDDIVGLAKLLSKFVKDQESFEFKAGVVEGKVIDLSELQSLASMPSKEVLIAKLLYMMNYPIQGLATALAGVTRNFAVVLDQIKQQKEKSE